MFSSQLRAHDLRKTLTSGTMTGQSMTGQNSQVMQRMVKLGTKHTVTNQSVADQSCDSYLALLEEIYGDRDYDPVRL
jgi:hypothetical protein